MKLYCVEILNNNKTVDVQHMFANESKEIHQRMNSFLEECKNYGIQDEYNGCKFHEVNLVDGVNIGKMFNNYKITDDNKLIKEEL